MARYAKFDGVDGSWGPKNKDTFDFSNVNTSTEADFNGDGIDDIGIWIPGDSDEAFEEEVGLVFHTIRLEYDPDDNANATFDIDFII